ncbi:MAG: 50S ribosomal protein L25 [Bacteroidia bacterium]
MQRYVLEGVLRAKVGTAEARRYRRQHQVPCSLYGKGLNIPFLLPENEARKVVFTPNVYLFELRLEGKSYTAILREYQLHPVHDYVLHLDFMACDLEDVVTLPLPVKLVGLAEGVQMGGKLVPLVRRLRVRGKVKDLPPALEIDISSLKLGKTLTVAKVNIPGLEIVASPDTGIARVEVPRALRTQS